MELNNSKIFSMYFYCKFAIQVQGEQAKGANGDESDEMTLNKLNIFLAL